MNMKQQINEIMILEQQEYNNRQMNKPDSNNPTDPKTHKPQPPRNIFPISTTPSVFNTSNPIGGSLFPNASSEASKSSGQNKDKPQPPKPLFGKTNQQTSSSLFGNMGITGGTTGNLFNKPNSQTNSQPLNLTSNNGFNQLPKPNQKLWSNAGSGSNPTSQIYNPITNLTSNPVSNPASNPASNFASGSSFNVSSNLNWNKPMQKKQNTPIQKKQTPSLLGPKQQSKKQQKVSWLPNSVPKTQPHLLQKKQWLFNSKNPNKQDKDQNKYQNKDQGKDKKQEEERQLKQLLRLDLKQLIQKDNLMKDNCSNKIDSLSSLNLYNLIRTLHTKKHNFQNIMGDRIMEDRAYFECKYQTAKTKLQSFQIDNKTIRHFHQNLSLQNQSRPQPMEVQQKNQDKKIIEALNLKIEEQKNTIEGLRNKIQEQKGSNMKYQKILRQELFKELKQKYEDIRKQEFLHFQNVQAQLTSDLKLVSDCLETVTQRSQQEMSLEQWVRKILDKFQRQDEVPFMPEVYVRNLYAERQIEINREIIKN